MAITGAQLVQDAAYYVGVLGQDASPALSNDDAQLILRRLNRLLDSWSTERLMVFRDDAETMALSAGTAQYLSTLLAAGRPVAVGATWLTYAGVDYPIDQIDDEEYAGIAIKTIQAIPNKVWINNSYPNMQFTFWPIPFAPMTFNLTTQRVLTSTPVTMTTSLTFPAGYEKAFVDNLAVDICPAFGITPSPVLVDQAQKAKSRLKAINYQPSEMATPFDSDTSLDLAYIYKPW